MAASRTALTGMTSVRPARCKAGRAKESVRSRPPSAGATVGPEQRPRWGRIKTKEKLGAKVEKHQKVDGEQMGKHQKRDGNPLEKHQEADGAKVEQGQGAFGTQVEEGQG